MMLKILFRKLPLIPFAFFKLKGELKEFVFADMERSTLEHKITDCSSFQKFKTIFERCPEFRSLFYYRVHRADAEFKSALWYQLFQGLYPRQTTLYIDMNQKNIGKGLRIQHGFATMFSVESIGENC